jgi:alkylation response protein AidB-like acyl-CoA dehydrogenase
MVMMEEFGKGLVVEPYFATVVLFGGLLRAAGSPRVSKAQYIPSIIDGSRLGAFAYLERQSRYELADIATRATAERRRFCAQRREGGGQQRRQCRHADRGGAHRW